MKIAQATAALLVLTLSASLANAANFVLETPGNPAQTAYAQGQGHRLLIRYQGHVQEYVHQPRLDSPDGQYIGLYNAAARQSLRWPRSGQGHFGKLVNGCWVCSTMRIRLVPTQPTHTPVHVHSGVLGNQPNTPIQVHSGVLGNQPSNGGNVRWCGTDRLVQNQTPKHRRICGNDLQLQALGLAPTPKKPQPTSRGKDLKGGFRVYSRTR